MQIDAEGALALRVREGGASFRPIDKANLLAEVRAVATADTLGVRSAEPLHTRELAGGVPLHVSLGEGCACRRRVWV